jgi:Domain of unknown function (DUF4145)
MSKESHDVFCPKCNILVEAKVIASGDEITSSAVNPEDEADAQYHRDAYYVAVCKRCDSPFLIKESCLGVPGEFETITDSQLLYPTENRLPLDGVPVAVRRAYEQAKQSFTASLYEPCALMCRRCLEAACKHLGAKGKNLNARLEALEATGSVDARMIRWAHGIRLIGNEAAHDPESAVSLEDARDVLEFTEALLIYIFALNQRFSLFEARRSKPGSIS